MSASRARRVARAALLSLAFAAGAPLAAQDARPEVHVIATGGTIASDPRGGVSGEALVGALPGLDTVARVSVEEFSRVGSSQITPEHWVRLSRRIDTLFRERPSLAGVVVTHGTDTMEETAFFLHLTVDHRRPVVVTGAMRPAGAIGADGPANLWNAIRLAAHPDARERGTLVLLNDEVHAAAWVTKANTTRTDAFVSPEAGPVGIVDPDAVVFRSPTASPPLRGAFPLPPDGGAALPRVGIDYAYGGADGTALRAHAASGAAGAVVATVGRGNLPPAQREAAGELAHAGMVVVLSSRTNGGRVPVGAVRRDFGSGGGTAAAGGEAEPTGGVFGAGALNPQKARVLLMLALGRTSDVERIAEYFRRF